MSGPLKTAVIGLGWVAQNRHVPQILRNPDFELLGVIDRHDGRAAEVAGRAKCPHHAQAEALSDVPWLDQADLLVVATEPSAHHRLVTDALGRGLHVMTEKPFAMTVAEGEAMCAAARDMDRTLCITHNFQFATAMRRLDKAIARGELGEIKSVTGMQLGSPARRLPSWYETLPLGLFYDESPHLIYLLDRLAARPLRVERAEVIASTTGHVTPAQVNVTMFEEDGNRPFASRCNFEAPVSEWHLMVLGTKGMAMVDIFRDIYIGLPSDGQHTAWPIMRTSLKTTWDHWWQVAARGVQHVSGRLYYGNDHLYRTLSSAIDGDAQALARIGPERALGVLKLQHDIVAKGSLT